MELKDYKIIGKYTDINKRMLGYCFPSVSSVDLEKGIQYSVNKRYKVENAYVDNDYKHKKVNINLLELTEYIYSREPIITAYGVLFKKHGEVPNPLMKMIAGFIEDRKKLKKIMFKFPKGSDDFQKYNLLQLLEKLNANGLN